MAIVVGCCGFAIPGGMKSYYREFETVEIQSTFYNVPRVETIEKWRVEAPPRFEFVPKAFQGITHPSSSPTWRRFRGKLQKVGGNGERYGYFRQTEEVASCWKTMMEICSRLRAEAILIQTPPSFGCSQANILNMESFLTTVKTRNVIICWEPRGEWNENPDKIKQACSKLDLVHVVDIMRRKPVSESEISYIRLHGLNPKEFDYDYKYSDTELLSLRSKLLNLEEGSRKTYVFFNNTNMANDAKKFRAMLRSTNHID